MWNQLMRKLKEWARPVKKIDNDIAEMIMSNGWNDMVCENGGGWLCQWPNDKLKPTDVLKKQLMKTDRQAWAWTIPDSSDSNR